MSDAIGGNGGGGGGGGFDIGQMIGGLFGGGGGADGAQGGGGLQKILDPLGLIPGIAKLFQAGDTGGVSELGSKILKNDVGQFDPEAAPTGAEGPDADPTPTEFVPPKDITEAKKGWGFPIDTTTKPVPLDKDAKTINQNPGATKPPAQMLTTQSAQMQAAQSTKPPAGTTSALQGALQALDPKAAKIEAESRRIADETRAMTAIEADFDGIDTQGLGKGDFKDGRFGLQNLKYVVDDLNYPESLRSAAKYLLDHPELLSRLQAASGQGNGLVTRTVVKDYINTLLTQSQQLVGGANPPGTTTPPAGGKPPATDPGTHPPQTTPPDNHPPTTPPGTSATPHTTTTSLDERMNQMGQSLEEKQNELLDLYNIPDEKLTKDQRGRIQALPIEIQKATHRYQEMHDMISNLMKSFHDMSMNSLRHIG